MKNTIEKELKSLAEKILSDTDKDIEELKKFAQNLYENLSVLSFLEGFEEEMATQKNEGQVLNLMETEEQRVETEEDDERYAPDGTHYNPEGITEPNTEKIKNIVEQMPPETPKIHGEKPHSVDFENELKNLGVHYDDLPQFEPVQKMEPKIQGKNDRQNSQNGELEVQKPINEDLFEPKTKTSPTPSEPKKSLNDRLKKGVSFGLNDRLVFIKHLFGGNAGDYDRVLSQLNTFHSFEAAKNFLETMVKPDYNFWEGEEIYEERFLKALESKLN